MQVRTPSIPASRIFALTLGLLWRRAAGMSVIKRMEKEAGLVYRLQLHIKPGAKRSQVTDVGTESIGLQISAPPRDGEANEEVCRFVAECLGIRQRQVELIGGHKCREKVVLVRMGSEDSRSEEDVLNKLRAEAL